MVTTEGHYGEVVSRGSEPGTPAKRVTGDEAVGIEKERHRRVGSMRKQLARPRPGDPGEYPSTYSARSLR
jgi:hypothetical protein